MIKFKDCTLKQVNELVAEHVMGWKRTPRGWDSGSAIIGYFDPMSDLNHCYLAEAGVDEDERKKYVTILREVNPGRGGRFHAYVHVSAPVRCKALLVLRGVVENDEWHGFTFNPQKALV